MGVARGGVHLDVGCGYGRIAEALRDRAGTDLPGDRPGRGGDSPRSPRGFEASLLRPAGPRRWSATVREGSASRCLGSISIDTLEHLPEPGRHARPPPRELAPGARCPADHLGAQRRPPGRRASSWPSVDGTTPPHRHSSTRRTFRFFTEARLRHDDAHRGWHETGAERRLARAERPALSPRSTRRSPADVAQPPAPRPARLGRRTASINQFVRAYLVGPRKGPPGPDAAPPPPAPFLTVVTRTQGRRLGHPARRAPLPVIPDLPGLRGGGDRPPARRPPAARGRAGDRGPPRRASISASGCILVDHGGRTTPLNVGLPQARGDYVAILDDDDFVFAHWVETFQSLSGPSRAGAASEGGDPDLRAGEDRGRSSVGARGGRVRAPYSPDFDFCRAPGGEPDPAGLGGLPPDRPSRSSTSVSTRTSPPPRTGTS